VPLGRILADLRAPPVIDFLSLDVEGFEERTPNKENAFYDNKPSDWLSLFEHHKRE
jgi:hypothetical protein